MTQADPSAVQATYPGGQSLETLLVKARDAGWCSDAKCRPCVVHEADEEWEKEVFYRAARPNELLPSCLVHRCKHCGALWAEKVT